VVSSEVSIAGSSAASTGSSAASTVFVSGASMDEYP